MLCKDFDLDYEFSQDIDEFNEKDKAIEVNFDKLNLNWLRKNKLMHMILNLK